jgi:hypothetical protein
MAKAVLGFSIIAISLQAYSAYVSSIPIFVGPMSYQLEYLGYTVIILMLIGLLVGAFGLRQFLGELPTDNRPAPAMLLIIARVFAEGRYKRIMVAVTLIYGAFFAVVSGIVVYRPMENFAREYFAQIPSAVIAVCCGGAGLVPVLTVFLTEHIGLLIIPANILILVIVSALVGLNASLIVCEYDNRPRSGSRRWVLGVGAVTGLFTACPTCAGLFFSSIVMGLGSSALVILPSTQLYFVVGTILVLVGGVYLSTRVLGQTILRRCER